MLKRALFAILAIGLMLAGCSEDNQSIKVGTKNFGESNILSHMISLLAKEKGAKVAGVVEYPNTAAILEALKRGDIDVYPDYNGTGLVMAGQNPTPDGDETTKRVKELYDPLGLTWMPRFGFANNYGLAMNANKANELGIKSISDLAKQSSKLTLGIEDDFQNRPLDGVNPLNSRYGMSFSATDVTKLDDRAKMYDKLLDGKIDVAEVYTTDGQIADYGLVILEDDLHFFPVYEASALARADSLSKFPALGEAATALAGKIDAATMQALNRRVETEGRSAESVARAALVEMGLLSGGAVASEDPLVVAATPAASSGALANTALRGVRQAFSGREVKVETGASPLAALASGDARLALVGANSFFDVTANPPARNDAFEAVAVAGQNLVHIIANRKNAFNLANAKSIAVGPEGSDSHQIASLIKSGIGLSVELQPQADDQVATLLTAVQSGNVDLALVLAPSGDKDVAAVVDGLNYQLVDIVGWSKGANLVRYPFLRKARVAANTYRNQFNPVDTLSLQVVLAGMAPVAQDAVGDQGPSAIATTISPLPDSSVKAIVGAIPGAAIIDPALRQAAALAPELPTPPAAINPAADVSLFNIFIVVLFIWLGWLYVRPEYN